MKAVIRLMFRRAKRIIVLGSAWRKFVCEEIGVNREQVIVLHNSVPVPVLPSRKPPPRHCRILFLGRLGTRKGVPELLQALATDRVASLEWTAILAGDGDIEHYKKMAAELNLDDRIQFPGWVGPEVVSNYLKNADILALPSHREGLPMSVLEGMAYGVAIITTPVGAVTEAIDDGISGLLVQPGDVNALSHALTRVLTDTKLRCSLSRAARKSFIERFDVHNLSIQLTKLYRQCITEDMTATSMK